MTLTREIWSGPAGDIQVLVDRPTGAPRGIAVVAHPHPLLGGTADHKVPAVIASRQCADGWLAVRPCFRGVGTTQGQHDHGVGETEDMIAVVSRLDEQSPDLPLVLIGFSFGAYVQTRVVRRMQELGRSPSGLALVGTGIGEVTGGRFYDTGSVPHDTLVIHGERDEHVPLV